MSEFLSVILPYLAGLVVSMLFFTPVVWGFFFTNSLFGTLGQNAEDYLQARKTQQALENDPEKFAKYHAEKKDQLPAYLAWSFSLLMILCFFLQMHHLRSVQQHDFPTINAVSMAKLQAEVGILPAVLPGVGKEGAENIQLVQLDGKTLYENNCVSCHQADGNGVPNVFPPLNGSEWVSGDPGIVVKIVLNGLTGPIEVAGNEYNSVMAALGGVLSDQDITEIVNYVRNSWTNQGSTITVDEVMQIREETASRTTAWTAAELK